MRTYIGEFLQDRHDVKRCGIAVGILALRQRPCLLALRAAGEIGDQFEQRIGRRRQRDVVKQDLAQRPAAHLSGMGGAQHGDDLVNQPEVVAGENAEGVANDVIQTAAGKIELDMPGCFFRSRPVQQAPRDKPCGRRIVARAARLDDDRGDCRSGGSRRWRQRRDRRLVDFFIERLQHPGGFLAAGNTEVEPRLAFARDRFRIIVTVIAALAAILLRHRRHHAPAQRAAFGEFHAVGDRHGLVMPRRFAVIAIAGGPLHYRRTLLRRQWRRAIGGQQTGEEAVEPGALRFGERRAAGDDLDPGWRRDLVHEDTSASASLRSVWPSWRRANVRNVSSGESRFAR